MNTPLQQTAQAVIARWESPKWKDEAPTAVVIGALLKALTDEQAQAVEPVATVQCINGVTIGYLDVLQPVGTKLYLHPAPPPAKAQHDLPLELLERLSKTLTNLGYSTPEGGMEHFGARIESQLYNLCRGVDSILAQQVAVPMTEAQIFACDPVPHVMFDQQRIDFARAIEAHHGIGAKP